MRRTPDFVNKWVKKAKVGDSLMYLQADHCGRAEELAEAVRELAEQGLVFMYQKKVREGVFNYYIRRVSKETGKIIKPWSW